VRVDRLHAGDQHIDHWALHIDDWAGHIDD
jgi:hypothetical protein